MAEKYPSISSYAYVANNPINAIDPDGREIIIIGEKGKRTTYKQGMEYEGEDKFTSNMIKKLNDMYTTSPGMDVIDSVVSNEQIVTITNDKLPKEGAVGLVPDESAGTMKLGNMEDVGVDLNTIAHELFHGYQEMNEQGGTSIKNEVEAYLFGDLVERLYNESSNSIGTIFQTSENIDWFENTHSFYEKSFSIKDFQFFVENFKTESGANADGKYNKFPLERDNQSINLYQKFHPIPE
ncbi:MAG: hypothetical protein ACQESK_04370 [Bacteroidota bacterium]